MNHSVESGNSSQVREDLAAMKLELHGNRILLEELVGGYRMFRFTGGDVPRAQWRLAALTNYLEHPLAADRLSTRQTQRYCELAETIMALGQTVAQGRPRTLKARGDIANRFSEASETIRLVGGALETGLTALLKELFDSSNSAGRMHALENEDQDLLSAEQLK